MPIAYPEKWESMRGNATLALKMAADFGKMALTINFVRPAEDFFGLSREEEAMNIVCLDMEGVLVPEIWIAFAQESGIPELRRTTRDEPDYD